MRALAAAALAVAALGACGGGGTRARGEETAAVSATSGPPRATPAAPERVEAIPVNRGTQGMRMTVRWALSPDRRAILVVEDPVSVEADALPDGFLYASETTGSIMQIDSVWDVAPSPDWSRLAFGRAYVLRGGESDTIPAAEWRRVEAQLPEDVGERTLDQLYRYLKARTFPVSGMSLMLGLGLTQVVWLDRPVSGHHGPGSTHSLHGWRVRWTRGGDTLAVGAEPRSVQDDAPPARWVLVRPRPWANYRDSLGGTTDSSGFARVSWIEGPTLERAAPLTVAAGAAITVDGGTVEARGGSIRLTRRGPDGRPATRLVGPGVPLAATARGRFIVALVPRDGGSDYEMAARTVVYHVSPE